MFLCTLEAFIGLLYAGMCAAILFGKVNRVQCHAPVEFANPVCLLYEEMESFVHSYREEPDSDEDIFVIEEDGDIAKFSRPVSFMGDSVSSSSRACLLICTQFLHQIFNSTSAKGKKRHENCDLPHS